MVATVGQKVVCLSVLLIEGRPVIAEVEIVLLEIGLKVISVQVISALVIVVLGVSRTNSLVWE